MGWYFWFVQLSTTYQIKLASYQSSHSSLYLSVSPPVMMWHYSFRKLISGVSSMQIIHLPTTPSIWFHPSTWAIILPLSHFIGKHAVYPNNCPHFSFQSFLSPSSVPLLLCPVTSSGTLMHHWSAKIHFPKFYSMKLSHVVNFFIFSSVCLRGSLKKTDEDEDELKRWWLIPIGATSPLKSIHNFRLPPTNHLNSTIRPSTVSPSLPVSVSETLIHAFTTSTVDYDNNHLLIHSHDPCPPEPPLGPRSPHSTPSAAFLLLWCDLPLSTKPGATKPATSAPCPRSHHPRGTFVRTAFNVSYFYDFIVFPNVLTMSSFIFYNAQHSQSLL